MSRRPRSTVNPAAQTAGWCVVVFALAGMTYAACAGLSQWLYFSAKYGAGARNVDLALDRIAQAHRFYGANFFASTYAAEQAWHAAGRQADTEKAARLYAASERWCRTGLRQNNYDRSLRLRWAALLAREDVHAAIAYMETFLEWQFWDPWNHAVLAELYARAGELDAAQRALYWVRTDGRYIKQARRMVDEGAEAFLRSLRHGATP